MMLDKENYISAIWKNWRTSKDTDWNINKLEMFLFRVKATICIALKWRVNHNYNLEGIRVGITNFHGPYPDLENGGQQAHFNQIEVAYHWNEWWYTDYSDSWQ